MLGALVFYRCCTFSFMVLHIEGPILSVVGLLCSIWVWEDIVVFRLVCVRDLPLGFPYVFMYGGAVT